MLQKILFETSQSLKIFLKYFSAFLMYVFYLSFFAASSSEKHPGHIKTT